MGKRKSIKDSRRIGRFSIPLSIIDNEGYKLAKTLFSHIVIIQAVMLWHNDTIEYTGYSELFDKVPPYTSPFEYQILILDNDRVLAQRID